MNTVRLARLRNGRRLATWRTGDRQFVWTDDPAVRVLIEQLYDRQMSEVTPKLLAELTALEAE